MGIENWPVKVLHGFADALPKVKNTIYAEFMTIHCPSEVGLVDTSEDCANKSRGCNKGNGWLS